MYFLLFQKKKIFFFSGREKVVIVWLRIIIHIQIAEGLILPHYFLTD